MRLYEIKNQFSEDEVSAFLGWVDSHFEGYKSGVNVRRIINSPISKLFRSTSNTHVYRAWGLNPQRAIALQGRFRGPYGPRRQFEQNGIVVPTKSSFLSWSWSLAGAQARARGDDFLDARPEMVGVITKAKLSSSTDVLFNLYQFAKESKAKLGIQASLNTTGLLKEQEVILPANEYYLTINPEEVVEYL